eukprot:1999984-Pleurochrysis_carterae.AAC.1
MKVADEALRLDMEEMAASEAASAAEEECAQAKRAVDARGWEINMDSDSEEDEKRKQGKDKEGNVEEQNVGEEDSEMAKRGDAAEHMHLIWQLSWYMMCSTRYSYGRDDAIALADTLGHTH